jgi:hypothetical protein
VLALPLGPEPARFGVPVPEAALAEGLRLRGPGAFQWRRLPLDARGGLCWIEVVLVGARGTARIVAGHGGDGGAQACVHALAQEAGRTEETWAWADGSEDRRTRAVLQAPESIDGEPWEAGEWRREESDALGRRCIPAVRLPRRLWEAVGILPADQGLAQRLRPYLGEVANALQELPGARGAGDFARSGGVVTNLEFDTTLACLRLALALQDDGLLLRARRCAMHLVDRDLDARTGLPFPHGPGHRTGRPEPGHVWLQGCLWVGAVCAEDDLLRAARQIAHGLAAAPPTGEGPHERARDYAWPLLELEAWLAAVDDPPVARAADRLAAAIGRRFDVELRTFRFGEGEVGGGVYLERAWLTGGIVLPALRAHLRRRQDAELEERVAAATQGLLDRIGAAARGLPTHWRCAGGSAFGTHLAVRDPRALLLLEGLPAPDLRRLLRRDGLWRTIEQTPAREDPDLATSLTMVARCTWIYR